MDKLITVIPPDKVTKEYKDEAAKWVKWDSKTRKAFTFNYATEERVLIIEGQAEIAPDGGGEVIKIGKGDAVTFHKGFKCKWKITKRMKKHYVVDVDEDAEEPPAITCDLCDIDCVKESYFMADDEQDICPKCYAKDEDKYPDAEHQKEGEKWVEETKKPAKKKRKTKK